MTKQWIECCVRSCPKFNTRTYTHTHTHSTPSQLLAVNKWTCFLWLLCGYEMGFRLRVIYRYRLHSTALRLALCGVGKLLTRSSARREPLAAAATTTLQARLFETILRFLSNTKPPTYTHLLNCNAACVFYTRSQ
jgi:hypothetical protein